MTSLRMLPAALAAAMALGASAAQAEMKTQWVEYSQGGMNLKAYLAYDDKTSAKRPAIFVVHDRAGMTPDTLKKTEMWAGLGYVAFATDIFGYGQGVLPKEVADMQAQTDIYTKNHPLMRARTQAGYDLMLKQPMVDASKVALIGSMAISSLSTSARNALSRSVAWNALRRIASRSCGTPGGAR